HGRGRAAAVLPDAGGRSERFSSALECAACGFAVRDPVPNLFSFNSPLGACETCRGFGRVIDLDLDLVVPDPRRPLGDGALKPWSTKATAWERGELMKFCRRRGISTTVPWADLGAAERFFATLALPAGQAEAVAGLILAEIRSRLRYLVDVGLEYLTLDRQSRTLSGGELERVDLTTAIGSSLVNTLYVLDEPSIGLHPRDSRRLVEILHRLRSNQNTIVVVEHDPEIIKESDYIIDLGPKAGEQGGQVMFAGSYDALLKNENSLTAAYLSRRKTIPFPLRNRRPFLKRSIKIEGACANNLKNIDIEIPL